MNQIREQRNKNAAIAGCDLEPTQRPESMRHLGLHSIRKTCDVR